MTITELIQRAMQRQQIASMRELGRALGVSHTIISRWSSGERAPDFENAAALAEMAGLPPVKTAAEVRLHTPEGQKHRGILRRIAAAAGILLVVGLPLPAHAVTNRLAVYTAISQGAAGLDINRTFYTFWSLRRRLARWMLALAASLAGVQRHEAALC